MGHWHCSARAFWATASQTVPSGKAPIASALSVAAALLFGLALAGWTVAAEPTILSDSSSVAYHPSFSADGKRLALFYNVGGLVRVWDVTTRKPLMEVRAGRPALSPDGKLLASNAGKEVASDKEAVTLWDVDKKRKRVRLPIEAHVSSLAFSPDSKLLALGDQEGRVCLWDVAKAEVIAEPGPNPAKPIVALLFSPDGRILAYSSGEVAINAYGVEKGKLVATLKGDWSTDRVLAFSKDGKVLAYTDFKAKGGKRPRVVFWDIAAGKEAGEMLTIGFVEFLCQLEDGKTWLSCVGPQYVLEAGEPGVTLRDLVESPRRVRPTSKDEHASWVTVTPDRKKVVLSVGNEVRIIDMPDFPPKGTKEKGSKSDH